MLFPTILPIFPVSFIKFRLYLTAEIHIHCKMPLYELSANGKECRKMTQDPKSNRSISSTRYSSFKISLKSVVSFFRCLHRDTQTHTDTYRYKNITFLVEVKIRRTSFLLLLLFCEISSSKCRMHTYVHTGIQYLNQTQTHRENPE